MNTIIEQNKLIAEFMGYKMVTESCCEFHSDWSCLMSAVEAIEKKEVNIKINSRWNEFNKCTYHQATFYIEKGEMSADGKCIYDSKRIYKQSTSLLTSKINAVYKAVVQFILWYNQLKK